MICHVFTTIRHKRTMYVGRKLLSRLISARVKKKNEFVGLEWQRNL